MAKFEVGKTYEWYQSEYESITVLGRTEKSITVTNGRSTWRMMVKNGRNGSEYIVDSSVPKRWRDAFTCSAEWEEK